MLTMGRLIALMRSVLHLVLLINQGSRGLLGRSDVVPSELQNLLPTTGKLSGDTLQNADNDLTLDVGENTVPSDDGNLVQINLTVEDKRLLAGRNVAHQVEQPFWCVEEALDLVLVEAAILLQRDNYHVFDRMLQVKTYFDLFKFLSPRLVDQVCRIFFDGFKSSSGF